MGHFEGFVELRGLYNNCVSSLRQTRQEREYYSNRVTRLTQTMMEVKKKAGPNNAFEDIFRGMF